MKGVWLIILISGISLLGAVSIFEIQFTNDTGSDNTFPSPYLGKAVSVEGIVTATGYTKGGFFITEQTGGPWRSLYIRSENAGVRIGDRVVLKGVVDEYYGMTCLKDVKSIRILDSNYPLPFVNQVTTGQITTPDQAEAYECTLVKVRNATFIQNRGNGGYTVSDGSGSCLIGNMLSSNSTQKSKANGMFSSLTGIVCYAFGEYSINPRNSLDTVIMVPVFNQNRSWGRIKSIYR